MAPRFFDLVAKRTVLDIALATILILLFGEILPKIYASRNRVAFSLFMALLHEIPFQSEES